MSLQDRIKNITKKCIRIDNIFKLFTQESVEYSSQFQTK